MLSTLHEEINTKVQIDSCEPNAIDILLQKEPKDKDNNNNDHETFSDEQLKDQELKPIILYLQDGTLPDDNKLVKKVVTEATLYAIFNDILYYVGPTQKETSSVVIVTEDHTELPWQTFIRSLFKSTAL